MLAVLALIAFVVSLVVYGSLHGWVAWMLLGLIFLAADAVFIGFGYSYPRLGGRRR
jgi:hypothetical protein